jgi:phage-related minor tail protein
VKVPFPAITTVFEQLVESAGSTKHLVEIGSSLVTTTLAVIAVLTAVVPDGLETVGSTGAFTVTVC